MDKPRVLLYGDYCCATGFAQVLGNIARELAKTDKYDIDVLAINYNGDPVNSETWPGRVYPAMPGAMMQAGPYADVYGRQRLLDLMGSGHYDAVYIIQDTFIIQPIIDEVRKTQDELASRGMKTFTTIFYFPVDSLLKKGWAETVAKADFPVVYTQFGKKELLRHIPSLEDRIRVIYHGNNPEHFFPIQNRDDVKEFRSQFFRGQADDRFLMININRNQPRKDIARSLMILKELWDRGRTPLLYLHMQYEDAGGNIFSMAEQLGLGDRFEFFLPSPNIFTANQGMPLEDLNRIYNAADMVLTTTLGEGWGLSITEAMATKTPIVGPDNTSLHEIMDNNRGVLVPSGEVPGAFIVKENDNERIRPLMNVSKAADAIEKIMDGQLPNIHGAYSWVRELDWSNVCKQWVEVFDTAIRASVEINRSVQQALSAKPNRAQRRAKKKRKK